MREGFASSCPSLCYCLDTFNKHCQIVNQDGNRVENNFLTVVAAVLVVAAVVVVSNIHSQRSVNQHVFCFVLGFLSVGGTTQCSKYLRGHG